MKKIAHKNIRLCYFGFYDPKFSRNKIYIKGLRDRGVEVIECNDNSKGYIKFFKLFIKHWKIRKKYDFLVVGYPGHIIVPFAKLIAKGPVIFDALCTAWEAEVLSHRANFFSRIKYRLVDYLAFIFADIVLVETKPQRDYVWNLFGGRKDKYKVIYTSVDEEVFFCPENSKKLRVHTVLFRGRLTPEAGVRHIIEAARILSKENINWRIIGFGYIKNEIEDLIKFYNLSKVEFISYEIPINDLCEKMYECHVSLGQFEKSERLERTIPHKAFESLAIRLPYITARGKGVESVFTDQKDCLFVAPGSPEEIANAILRLKNDLILSKRLADEGYKLFKETFSNETVVNELFSVIKTLRP